MKQISSALLAIIIILLGFIYKDTLFQWIESDTRMVIPVAVVFVALLVFFPVVPYPMLAGLLGSTLGVWNGVGASLLGIFLGTSLMFWMTRYGFKDWAKRKLDKYPKTEEYEHYFTTRAFMGVLLLRIIPIVPSPLVNIISAISSVRWFTFISASLLGKLPAVTIYTVAGSFFEESKLLSFLIFGLYIVMIMALATWYSKRKQQISVVKY
ncbi:TVP38/TMEM64 family protein [Bacillus sp. DJP31]|uniref:TVP38/TMEM64 family protein n=1 Tax=Bacillus sp. DJP31 TaxID=3409789 RepID=UPI003BB6A8D0